MQVAASLMAHLSNPLSLHPRLHRSMQARPQQRQKMPRWQLPRSQRQEASKIRDSSMPSQLHLVSLRVVQAAIRQLLLSQMAARHEPLKQLLANLEVRCAALNFLIAVSKNWEIT